MTTSSGSRPISTSRKRSSPSSSPSAARADAPVAARSARAAAPDPAPRILGIDPGSRATGYGVILPEGSRLRYERSGVIAPRANLSFPDRLLAVYDGLSRLLEELRPDEVAVETAFVRKSALAALQLGHVRGVVLLAARQSGAAVYEYTAPEVKMAVVRQGAAAKEQVAFMVRRLLPGVGVIREDEADALAVALCHAHRAARRSLETTGPRGAR
ncbi:MAG: crossover junction endodeoxyribonuclease RuvC [Hyphomicrobiales bacterium]